MKLLLGTVMALMLAAAPPAAAQKLDLSKVTCKQFVESSKENIGLILMWLHGYWTDEDDPPIIDFDRLTADAEKLGAYCGKNPDASLIQAAEAELQ